MPSSESFFDSLNQLLGENITHVKERERTAFDIYAHPHSDSLVLFGAGGLGRKTLAGLRKIGVEPLAFVDNNSALWGQRIDNLFVFSPAEGAQRFGQSAAFVVTIWFHGAQERMAQRIKQLTDLGCKTVSNFGLLYWKYPEIFLPHYSIDLPSKLYAKRELVQQAASLWADEESQCVYLSEVRFRALMDFDAFSSPVKHATFFPDDLWEHDSQDIFVDCGAFTGDTLEVYLNQYDSRFKHIIAFEPDSRSFSHLNTSISTLPPQIRDKISLYPLALGNVTGKVNFDASGLASASVGNGASLVDSGRLDDMLHGISPTHIKMDIEGAEIDALYGAAQTISRCKPRLSITVYHRQDHLWKIPLLLHAISKDYRFYLRPHQLEGWDLVCYAVPQ